MAKDVVILVIDTTRSRQVQQRWAQVRIELGRLLTMQLKIEQRFLSAPGVHVQVVV